MRNPEKVLNSLAKHSGNSDYKFERLYKVMFNEEMYYAAYQNIYSNVGNMTAGVDGKTIDGMSMLRIERLIDTLRNETYQPNPSKRTYIPKKNGKKRPLGIPSFDDKLVQEVIRMILEAIYEGSFEYTSHGFRPKRSCHTALLGVQQSFTATRWFIEGDIKGFFDNINHEVLIDILKERIADDRFIRLIRKFLNAGYVEDWVFHRTYSGTPQGGIISPLLANIYLDKFDKYIKEYIDKFNKGERKRHNRPWALNEQRRARLAMKLKEEEDENVKKQMIVKLKELVQERSKYPAYNKMDSLYKRMKYVRYADDFLIGVIGTKEDCKAIKDDIRNYLNEKLKLELSDEKTLITNAKKPAKFLGYDIFVRQSNDKKRDKLGRPVRCFGDKIVLYVTTEVMQKKLLSYNAMKLVTQKSKEVWKPRSRYYMKDLDDLEIISQVNSELRGFANYYSIANNSAYVQSFSYIMEYSMYKTYALKYQTSVGKEKTKRCINGVFTIPYKNKEGKTLLRRFYKEGFKRQKVARGAYVDNVPKTITTTGGRNSLIARLQTEKCEQCGATEKLEMHHVRKVKDLKGKQDWEKRMIARNRKTLAVCSKCHDKIHAGKLD
ncbi:group II intron reverse transcriptase/maturase [Arcticibacter tournemirensis]|uniref:Group II intron reverse transcriptase/maturase n=1 Tax=Arcticibacter tournemirensis TaxID=699437 RepID=A0A5M9GZF2_9SPHI|nr:group II intron reverse transcriptase/maturase [Arcticibacter tournemirensis]KAA8480082.1 group II intron reverse transcriptase/maturase [Arcticibacter tournemirensis]TQM50686.1 group II intron reverse transcriptase/maturase [Arcticibacter tournemirensis]